MFRKSVLLVVILLLAAPVSAQQLLTVQAENIASEIAMAAPLAPAPRTPSAPSLSKRIWAVALAMGVDVAGNVADILASHDRFDTADCRAVGDACEANGIARQLFFHDGKFSVWRAAAVKGSLSVAKAVAAWRASAKPHGEIYAPAIIIGGSLPFWAAAGSAYCTTHPDVCRIRN